jgi:hypothetical protein
MPSYQEGREARRNGQAKADNPYPAGTPMARNWAEGWTDSNEILRAMERYQQA